MNRLSAVLIPVVLVALLIIMVATEQNRPSEPFDKGTFVIWVTTQVLFLGGCLWYIGFAALHSTQYIASPQGRSGWLFIIIGLNIFGACYYFTTLYQSFRKEGKGRLMSFTRIK